MSRFVLILSLLTSTYQPAQGKIISLGSSSKQDQFHEHIAKNPHLKSLNSAIILKKEAKSQKVLKHKYKLAKEGLRYEDLKPSIFLYKEIVNYPKYGVPTAESDFKLILESFYMLSNLERDTANYWVKEGILMDLSYQPSDVVFNPNVIKMHAELKNQMSSYFYNQSKALFSDLDTQVFANGRKIYGSLPVHASASYALEFYKPGYQVLETKVSGQELLKLKPVKMTKRFFGTCKNPVFSKYNGVKPDLIYFNKNCIADRHPKPIAKTTTSHTKAKNKFKLPKSFKITSAKKTWPTPQKANKDLSAFSPVNKPIKPVSFFKKKSTWLVVGGALATAAIMYAINEASTPAPAGPREARVVPVKHD